MSTHIFSIGGRCFRRAYPFLALCLLAVCVVWTESAPAASAPSPEGASSMSSGQPPPDWKVHHLKGGMEISLPGNWKSRRPDSGKSGSMLFQAFFRQGELVLAGVQVSQQPLPTNLIGLDHDAAFDAMSEHSRRIPLEQVKRSMTESGLAQVSVHEARYVKINGRAARYFSFSYQHQGAPMTARRVLMPDRERMLVLVVFSREGLEQADEKVLDRIISTFKGNREYKDVR